MGLRKDIRKGYLADKEIIEGIRSTIDGLKELKDVSTQLYSEGEMTAEEYKKINSMVDDILKSLEQNLPDQIYRMHKANEAWNEIAKYMEELRSQIDE